MGALIDEIINKVNKEAKEEIITNGLPSYSYTRIPFTSPRMNYITYGGLPLGRLVEFFGEEGGGKTTTALDVVANFQNMYPDKVVLYVDAENTLDTEWALKIGVDIESIKLFQPKTESAEQIFELIKQMTLTGELGLWVLDSVPTLTSEKDLEKDLTDDARVGGISGILTRFCREIVGACAKNDCMGIFINQIRDKIDSRIPGQINTPGGRALKHYCSNRIQFSKGSYVDENGKAISRSSGEPNSQKIMVNMVKTKSCRPKRHIGQCTLSYESGIDYLTDLVDMAIQYDIIDKSGSWFTGVDIETGEILMKKIQGQNNVNKFLDEHVDVMERIEELVNNCMEKDS